MHLEFTKFVKIMGAKGAKICLNVKTQWINMSFSTKHVMA